MKDSQSRIEILTPNEERARMSSNERKAMRAFLDFIQKSGRSNNKFNYTLDFTDDDPYSGYDCLLSQFYKETGKLKRILCFEIKIRTSDYHTLLIEKQKFEKLLSLGDISKNKNVFYINFTPAKTVVFDLVKLHNTNKIHFINESHNLMSYNKGLGKIQKEVAYLDVKYGKSFGFVYEGG